MQGGVAGGERAAHADSEQVQLIDLGVFQHAIDDIVGEVGNIVIDSIEAVRAFGVAPIYHVHVDALPQKVAYERAVWL